MTVLYLLNFIVDDMLVERKNRVEIDRLKPQMSLEFEIDLGEAKKIPWRGHCMKI